MKFYLKQDGGLLKNSFTVYREDESVAYVSKGNIGGLVGLRNHIYDATGTEELAFIKQRMGRYVFDVFVDGQVVATVRKKFFSLRSKYTVDVLGWGITGKALFHDYTFVDASGEKVVQVAKKAFRIEDTFEADIVDDKQDPVVVIAVILAMDAAINQAGF